MQTISSYLVKISVNVVNYCTIITWYKIVIDNCFCDWQSSKGNNSKSINDTVTILAQCTWTPVGWYLYNESVHQPNLSATVSTSACETNPESESSSSTGSQSDEMPVPDARLFSSGKYDRRFTWLYYNGAKGGYCCKFCEIFCPFLPTMQVNRFVSGVLLGTHPC